MNTSLDITFRDVEQTVAIKAHIKNRTHKLEQFSNQIIRCHVVVEKAPSKHSSAQYNVKITASIPQHELVAHSNITDNLYKSIHNAFTRIQRQLEDHHRSQDKSLKRQTVQTSGVITKLFLEDEFGFIETPEGYEEYYFNSDNLVSSNFDHLEIGDDVHFTEANGREGPQARRVKPSKRKHN